jgi:hypothetical protein
MALSPPPTRMNNSFIDFSSAIPKIVTWSFPSLTTISSSISLFSLTALKERQTIKKKLLYLCKHSAQQNSMATNKNAVLRYNTLDKCFGNFGRKYYFDDLVDEVNRALLDFDPGSTGLKTRQLRDDIRFMKSE